jgi:hypothetical protein
MERQIFFNSRLVSFVESRGLSEVPFALCTFGRQQMPAACLGTKHFSCPSDFEALYHRFLRFASRYRFWHKEPGI